MHAPGQGRGQIEPWFAILMGAIVISASGASAGAAIGSTAMQSRHGFDYEMPQQPHPAERAQVETTPVILPDHYPITTPRGRFEVAELRERGLYASRRFRTPYEEPPVSVQVSYSETPDTPGDVSERPERPKAVRVTSGASTSVATIAPPDIQDDSAQPLPPLFEGG